MGTGTGTEVETRRRTQNGNGDGDGSEDSSGEGNGYEDNRNEDRIGEGGREVKKREKPQNNCRRESFNDWGGGYTTIPSPGRSPKQLLPGIGLHDPVHGRQACPNSTHFTKTLVKCVP